MCDHCSVAGKDEPDVTVENEGSVHVFVLNSATAIAWVHAHVESEPWMWMGPNRLVVDQPLAFGLVQGMMDHGLEVR